MTYISHARTPEQLKDEVVSDISRRITHLGGYSKVASTVAEKSRIASTIRELEQMLAFWTELQIIRPKTKRELLQTQKTTT